MLLKYGDPNNLLDLSPVQGSRLKQKTFETAVHEDSVDPFPDGAPQKSGLKGATSAKSVSERPALSLDLLRSFDGGLPDYLQEALFLSLHERNKSFYDFLGIIDRALLPHKLRVERNAVLVSNHDATRKEPSFLERLGQILGPQCANVYLLQLLPALQLRGRNLEMLRRIVAWWMRKDASVGVLHERRAIEDSARTRISVKRARSNITNKLGESALLGHFCNLNCGRITIDLLCENEKDLRHLENDSKKLNILRQIIICFLREPTPVSLYVRIRRKYVPEPRLRSRRSAGTKLGAYNCLLPKRRPEHAIRLKLQSF